MPSAQVTVAAAARPSLASPAAKAPKPFFDFHRDHRIELVPLWQFRPTQMAVGMRAVAAKSQKIARRAEHPRKFRRFLADRPIPAVVGPGAAYYIIDHHHLSLALWQNDIEETFVARLGDLSHLSQPQFISAMAQHGLLHAVDRDGRNVCPSELPNSLKDLKGDCYRDLAWSVRKAGGYAKSAQPFSEFRWANFFRQRIARAMLRRDFDDAHEMAMGLARSRSAAHLPGYVGRR